MSKRKQPRLVKVTWTDATKTSEEISKGDKIGTKLVAVGWVVKDNKDGLLLSMEWAPHKDVGEHRIGCSIPVGCIEKIEDLSVAPKPDNAWSAWIHPDQAKAILGRPVGGPRW